MAKIHEGSKAPKFTLFDKDGAEHGVGKTKADFIVLFFYPKDNTPGCTVESQEFSETLKKFARRGAKVIGISGGDQKTKQKFCSKYDLEVDLVSDTDFKVSREYGVYGEKKFMGRTYMGIHRTTFVVDKAGKIVKIFADVTPKGHAQEVLDSLDEAI
jgi:peroxiredoxin Q/BCP